MLPASPPGFSPTRRPAFPSRYSVGALLRSLLANTVGLALAAVALVLLEIIGFLVRG